MADQVVPHPTFEVGELVRLAVDEGLDTPEELQGRVGIVTSTYGPNEFSSYQSYFVQVVGSEGEEVYCEHYHLEAVPASNPKNEELAAWYESVPLAA